jgi:hypothetical protein
VDAGLSVRRGSGKATPEMDCEYPMAPKLTQPSDAKEPMKASLAIQYPHMTLRTATPGAKTCNTKIS